MMCELAAGGGGDDEETDGQLAVVSSDSDSEDGPLSNIFSYEEVLAAWYLLNTAVKKKVSYTLRISSFWWHILLRQDENHATTRWAIRTGFIEANACTDLSLQKLERIETLESILSAMERGWLSDKLTKQLIPMSACFQLSDGDLTDEAMEWLERTGEPNIVSKVQKLGPRYICHEILRFIFGKCSPLTTESVSGEGILMKLKEELSLEPDIWSREKSEDLKTRGNEQYRKSKFQLALKWYTKAIKHHPANHVLYGNRAICFIRIGKYTKALGDGKRATVLKPDWAKGHYRFCEALFLLDQPKKALEENERAHGLCLSDSEGIKELMRQREKFLLDSKGEDKPERPKRPGMMKSSNKRSLSALATCTEFQRVADPEPDPDPEGELDQANDELSTEKEEGEDLMGSEGYSGESDIGIHTKDNKDNKQMKSETKEIKSHGAASSTREKVKMKSQNSLEETPRPKSAAELKAELACAVQVSRVAWKGQNWPDAKQAFFNALEIIESTSPQELGISELDKLLLMYGYATALTEMGHQQALAEAMKQFFQIQSSGDERLECLVYFGMGRVFLKENRFSDALKRFCEALLVVGKRTPAELTWPTTNVPIKESQLDNLMDFLAEGIEICRFPPLPDAVCRHKNFQDHLKRDIYYTDPGFKGFHRMVCSQKCVVEFHTSCWKKFKTVSFPYKRDKDFLQNTCFTPDCAGTICHIVIIGGTGHIKCEFESSIPKQTTQRPRIKQQATRPKAMKIKEEPKLKYSRQMTDVSGQDHLSLEENTSIGESGKKRTVQAWLDEDHVLRQIGEMRDCFGDETLGVSAFMTSLKSWIERDSAKGLDYLLLNGEEPRVLQNVVDLLLQRKSRVWSRIFIHVLSDCDGLQQRLFAWAQDLNGQGLKAAEAFIGRYAEPLEQLDLGILLTFPPLQHALIERVGTMPDLFSSAGVTITQYLRQASSQEMRLFIWTLEEHRDEYPSCHTVLDEYFATDCSYLVIKKTEHENPANQHPKKSKRKKLKEPKSVLVSSGMSTGHLREEREDDFLYEEDSFMLLDTIDSFTIPDYLRDQLAAFEEECVGAVDANHIKLIIRRNVNNILDPTRDNLYDYFAQVLEEHGPLKSDHPLLVGELENFPRDAQDKIEEAGGLKSFLLESLRFLMKDDVIALIKHVGALQNVAPEQTDRSCLCHFAALSDVIETSLNPLAEEFHPTCEASGIEDTKTISGMSNIAASENVSSHLMKHNRDSSCALKRPIHVCPHVPFPQDPCSQTSKSSYPPVETFVPGRHFEKYATAISFSSNKQTGACVSPNAEQDRKTEVLASFNEKGDGSNTVSFCHGVTARNEQACSTIGDDVAVNTEKYELFENKKGGMTKKEKNNMEGKNRMTELKKAIESDVQKRKADLAQRGDVYDEISEKTEVINKELSLLQQRFDKEMKMYLPEKKENQETLKMLKAKICSSLATNDSFAKDIMEKNKNYETKCTCLSTISNQLAAEKADLKGEMDRYKHLSARQTKRSQFAGILILESRQAQGLRGLKRCVFRSKAILRRITELSSRYPSSGLEGLIDSWRACVHDAEQKISHTQALFRQQMDLVKDGTALSRLPHVSVPPCPPTPPQPVLDPQLPTNHGPRPIYSHHSAQMPVTFPNQNFLQLLDMSADMPAHGTKAKSVFEKIIDHLITMFPRFDRETLIKFTHDLVSANGGHLLSLPYEETINRISQHILDLSEDEHVKGQMSSTRDQASGLEVQSEIGQIASRPYSPFRTTGQPTPSHVWNSLSVSRSTPFRTDQMHSTESQTGLFSAQSEMSHMASRTYSPLKSADTPPPVWKSEAAQRPIGTQRMLNMEDPCIICHEDVAPETLCVLECRHGFHHECIKSWLNTQSTCPTCRKHVLRPEDFPVLPARSDKSNV